VIARFCDAARLGRGVSITGDGTQTRDFVYVADVARVNVAALTAHLQGRHTINVGTGRETSLLELRAAIAEVAGRPLPYALEPARPGDVMRSCADVARLRDLLGLTCSTSLRDGLSALLTFE
jgi:UDP-glucose 4-epimerase